MTHEERTKYIEELKEISDELKKFDEIFNNPSDTKIWELYCQINPLENKYNLSSTEQVKQKINDFKLVLAVEFQKKKVKKKELESLLSDSYVNSTKDNVRNHVNNAAGYLASITPQHVTGRIYKIENREGCVIFCLFFIIIDIVILFIYYLYSK